MSLKKTIFCLGVLCLSASSCFAETLTKVLYHYDAKTDTVQNIPVENTAYGSPVWSYEKNNRNNSDVRAARFLPQDILNCDLLDFGCNEGGVLFACRRMGAKSITGVDYNSWCIQQAQKKVREGAIPNARFVVGDMEIKGLYMNLPIVDTVFLLAILDTSSFANKAAVLTNVARHAKKALYYEGHQTPASHVKRMYELLVYTDFTRFEYLGHIDGRLLIRCSRQMMDAKDLPAGAVTSDSSESLLQTAKEIYVFTDASRNPAFSANCSLIQYVRRR